MRPALLHALDKRIDKSVVVFTADTMMSPSDVKRALQPILVVRSNIQKNRKAVFGMDPSERCIQRHLSDRNPHASRALIAEAKNSFAIADDNAFHIVIAGMTQNLSYTVFIWIAEK